MAEDLIKKNQIHWFLWDSGQGLLIRIWAGLNLENKLVKKGNESF